MFNTQILNRQIFFIGLIVGSIAIFPYSAFAGAPLETETTRLLEKGKFEVQGAFESYTSKAGQEYIVPLEFLYGLTNDVELLVEPVVMHAIKPKVGKSISGIGDTEITLFYRFIQETESLPAMAIAGEVKVPTAGHDLGTKKFDYTPYLVFSKKFGEFDTHLNLGYSFIGKSNVVDGEGSENTMNYSLATEYPVNEKLKAVAETSGKFAAGALTEASGLVGLRYGLNSNVGVSFAMQYDNQHNLLLRPGFDIKF